MKFGTWEYQESQLSGKAQHLCPRHLCWFTEFSVESVGLWGILFPKQFFFRTQQQQSTELLLQYLKFPCVPFPAETSLTGQSGPQGSPILVRLSLLRNELLFFPLVVYFCVCFNVRAYPLWYPPQDQEREMLKSNTECVCACVRVRVCVCVF